MEISIDMSNTRQRDLHHNLEISLLQLQQSALRERRVVHLAASIVLDQEHGDDPSQGEAESNSQLSLGMFNSI